MDVRKQVTDRIVERLAEGGLPPWRAGWTSNELHFNDVSKKTYRGINQLLCGMAGFADPRWMTFKQARAKGLHVRKGEKSTKVVRLVEIERKGKETPPENSEVVASEANKLLIMRLYDVFNAAQIEGVEPRPLPTHRIDCVQAAEGIVEGLKATGLTVLYGHKGASFSPIVDAIRMPPREAFHSTEDLYGTLLHECSHATGAAHRLNRLSPTARMGTKEYAYEELVAEIGACIALADVGLGAGLGQHHIDSHAAYIDHFLALLKEDSGALFRAAGAAQLAADYLRDHALLPEPHIVASEPAMTAPAPRMMRAFRQ